MVDVWPIMGRALCITLLWLSIGPLTISPWSSPALAQTDSELRDMYFAGDLTRMEEIARAGDVRAEAWMGLMLQNRRRRAEAKEWWRRAAEKDNRWAIGSLARMHHTDKDYERAAYWYRHGAEIGDAESQNSYAGILLEGRGVTRNEEEAARWYAAAARQEYRYAYLPLADLYASGTGVARDPVEALALSMIAEAVLDESDFEPEREARDLRERLEGTLSPQEKMRATERALAWRADFDRLLKIQGRLQP